MPLFLGKLDGKWQMLYCSTAMKMVPLIIISVAVVLLALAGYKAFTSSAYLKTTEVVPGRVVGYDYGEHSSTSNSGQGIGSGGVNVQTTMNLVIEYVTKKGETLSFRTSLGAGSLPEGELTIRYSTVDPNKVEVNSFINNWFPTILFGAIGGVLLLAGLLVRLALGSN